MGITLLGAGKHSVTAAVPWTIVDTATGAEVLSGDLTSGDAGDEGDLLVCGVVARDSAAFTLPAGWTLVATQQSSGNTTVDGTGSISSALLAWIIRGASAPALVFTRTGGDVARCFTAAYRGNHASPADTGSANTLGTASTAVTTTTITTAENNELLCVVYAGARNALSSDYVAATGATGSSGAGASDTTTAPADNTWIKRRSVGSAGGADYAIGFADAVMVTAGATGSVSCVAATSARHAMVVGAFKRATP